MRPKLPNDGRTSTEANLHHRIHASSRTEPHKYESQGKALCTLQILSNNLPPSEGILKGALGLYVWVSSGGWPTEQLLF